MPGKHGGGGSQNDVFRVDPEAVPGLRSAFADALAKVDRQLELANELRVTAWARDPVSLGAAKRFNDRSVDADHAAVEALRAYREQLDAAVVNLDKTAQQYPKVDGETAHGVGRNGDGA